MNRFFAFEKQNNYFILDKKTLKHIQIVSRKTTQEFIIIYNNNFYRCILDQENKAKILEQIDENHEFSFEVILAPSIIKFTRFEWMIEKAIELGATKIIPIISTNVVKDLINFGKFEKKYSRFNEILKSAAQQSFRNKLVTLEKPLTFEEALSINVKNKFLAHEKYEKNNENSIKNIKDEVMFFVGPEGGYTDKEIISALQKNVKIVSLGKRILRAETASIFLLSQLKNNDFNS